MRVHHLNCGTLCPMALPLPGGFLGALARSVTERIAPPRLVCHVLAIELRDGLALVDTGFGLHDIAEPGRRLGEAARRLLGPALEPRETALRQIEALGYRREDVRHILVTHLDLDHAGGLSDFPAATIHVHDAEHAVVRGEGQLRERLRYRSILWSHGPRWSTYARPSAERWMGFECVRSLPGLPPEILAVPLQGHTRGHTGIAVDTGAGWLLHAGDAYFHRNEMSLTAPSCPPGLRVVQALDDFDAAARVANQARLRALRREHGAEVHIFCAHDESELLAAAGARGSDGDRERPAK